MQTGPQGAPRPRKQWQPTELASTISMDDKTRNLFMVVISVKGGCSRSRKAMARLWVKQPYNTPRVLQPPHVDFFQQEFLPDNLHVEKVLHFHIPSQLSHPVFSPCLARPCQYCYARDSCC